MESLESADSDCHPQVHNKMREMLAIQDQLNVKFLGPDWKARAGGHEGVDYLPAILDEASELMRSNPSWKFWKKPAAPDIANTRMEFIDMLHFAMSEELCKTGIQTGMSTASAMAHGYEVAYNVDSNGDASVFPTPVVAPAYSYQEMKKALFSYLSSVFAYHSSFTNFDPLSELDEDESELALEEDDVGVEGAPEMDDEFASEVPSTDWVAFWEIAYNIGMTFEEVYLTYISKVSLNELRIANGDKTGEYQKLWWGGLEDNFFVMEEVSAIITSGSFSRVTGRGAFQKWLASAYELVKSGSDVDGLKSLERPWGA